MTTMKDLRYGLIALLMLVAFSAGAQDYRFSQFYNSPLNLNPALTGKVNGSFRAALNYRNQWFNVTDKPFITYAGSFDGPIQLRQDALGLGLAIVNDQTNGGIYNNTVIMASFAYHKRLDKKSHHTLSIGVQGGWYQRRLDRNDLRFFNQFDGVDYNQNLPSGEGDISKQDGNFDFQVGLLYNGYMSKKVNFYIGGAMYHVIEPKESLIGGNEYKLNRKYVAHAGMEYRVHRVMRLLPSVVYLSQAQFSELNLGLSLGFDMSLGIQLYAGAYYRMTNKLNGNFGASDCGIFYTAFEYNVVRLAFSYDATVSTLKQTPKPTGAFEMSLIIVGKPIPLDDKTLLFCPRF